MDIDMIKVGQVREGDYPDRLVSWAEVMVPEPEPKPVMVK